MPRKREVQTFNDGVCSVYGVENIALPGHKPEKGLTLKAGPLRYGEKTVGMSRFYSARQANVRIDRVIRVAKLANISTQDVAITEDGVQYDIRQIQSPEDIKPAVMYLSLERVVEKYDVE